ncbi:TPM domain-containing protein [Glaciibacter superstes]|uniref:TPM domain-containing protein n=1 Tax=Glaciibacter superstes TaxID=501023 RepID=UPI0003B782E6|nr:TPM domain-containing protein [Glaciibacter superstes]
MRARLMVGIGLLAAAMTVTVGVPTAAFAEDPVEFGSSHIVDKVGVLGDRESQVTDAVDRLYTETGTDLFVVYVDSFTGVDNRDQWADETADKNGMGATDVLLAVATGDRQYQLSVAGDFALTDAQLGEVESVAIESALRENDWAGAAIGAADGLTASLTGGEVTAPDVTPGEAQPSGSGGGFNPLWIVLLALVVIAIIVFFIVRSRRRASGGAGKNGGVPIAELKQQAGSALVQTDDAIKTSEQELGFAIAQYGADSTVEFKKALATAKEQLTQAFTLQQQLDDSAPDTEEQQRAWYVQIAELCEGANTSLDAQKKSFDALRALEKNAPAAAGAVAAEADGLDARVTAAESTLTTLSAGYTAESIATVADNAVQAAERLAFARAALTDVDARLAAGETATAAVGIRSAEAAVDQATVLVDAVDRLGTDLRAATQSASSTIADLEADLLTARGLPVGDGPSAALPAVIASTERTLSEAKSAMASGQINPIELGTKLEAANVQMDAVLQGVRDAEAQVKRARAALGQAIQSSHSQISAAEDFITTRRGAVGADARTRLAEAGRLVVLAESQAGTDPETALTSAQRANSLAAEAVQLARNDVGGFQDGGYESDGGSGYGGSGGLSGMFGGSSYGGGSSGGGGDLLMGAILGGLFSGGGGGGGRSSSGWGGGSSSRSRSSSRSSGSRRSSSGSRSRRGGGGRF